MRISTIGYVGKQGVKNIWRNKMFSLASVATMSACIFLFGLFFSIIVNFQYIIRTAEEGVAITVFFEEDATDAQKEKIGEELRSHEGVGEVRYVSAEEAWEEFQKQYFGDNPELAEGFKEDNPLANSDNYEVYMKTTEDSGNLMARSRSLSETQKELVSFAQKLDGVREVNKSDVVANTLSHACGSDIDRDHHYTFRCVHLPDQQHSHNGYYGQERRDRYYEIYRGKGLCGSFPIRDRRSYHRNLWRGNPVGIAIFPVRQSSAVYYGEIQYSPEYY